MCVFEEGLSGTNKTEKHTALETGVSILVEWERAGDKWGFSIGTGKAHT